MKILKWILFSSFFGFFLGSATTWASVDTSGYKFSLYAGWQKNTISPRPFVLVGNENEVLAPNQHNIKENTAGLGMAYRFIAPNHQNILRYTHDISIGLDVFYFRASQRGGVLDFGQANDFNYLLTLQSWRFMGNVEWTFLPITSQKIYPFLEIGMGVAANSTQYRDSPNPGVDTGIGFTISKHTANQFAYDAGLGLKWMPSKNMELSLRYLVTQFGTVRSGMSANLAMSAPFTIPLKTQSILIGLSYLLDK